MFNIFFICRSELCNISYDVKNVKKVLQKGDDVYFFI